MSFDTRALLGEPPNAQGHSHPLKIAMTSHPASIPHIVSFTRDAHPAPAG